MKIALCTNRKSNRVWAGRRDFILKNEHKGRKGNKTCTGTKSATSPNSLEAFQSLKWMLHLWATPLSALRLRAKSMGYVHEGYTSMGYVSELRYGLRPWRLRPPRATSMGYGYGLRLVFKTPPIHVLDKVYGWCGWQKTIIPIFLDAVPFQVPACHACDFRVFFSLV